MKIEIVRWAVVLGAAFAMCACGADRVEREGLSSEATTPEGGEATGPELGGLADAADDPPTKQGQKSPNPKSDPKAPDQKAAQAKSANANAKGEQDPRAAAVQDPEQTRRVVAEVEALMKENGITIDRKASAVAVECVMNNPDNQIEFLLVQRRGKTHEALLYTMAQPSVINAALMMIGYEPGVNFASAERDPLPTRQEVELGAEPFEVFPPRGMEMYMTVRWTDADGEVHERPVEDMLFDMISGDEMLVAGFIYLGGRMDSNNRGEDPVFFADVEGNLISTVYRAPANHLGSIVHSPEQPTESWWLTTRCPPQGTVVDLVIHREETALHVARRQRLAEEGARAAHADRDPNADPPDEQGAGAHVPVEPKPGGGKDG